MQRELYQIVDESIDFQIHLSKYRMKSQYGSTELPRYWITLDKDIIFDYPKQFVCFDNGRCLIKNLKGQKMRYPYQTDISGISDLIREYIDTPRNELMSKHFESDCWGLVNILRAADRRIGKRRLEALKRKTDNQAARKIIEQRLNRHRRDAAFEKRLALRRSVPDFEEEKEPEEYRNDLRRKNIG